MSVPDAPHGSLLCAARTAPAVTLAELAPPGRLLIVSPHPDDETFGCGMALAAAAAAGREIVLLLLTDGEGSHRGSIGYDREARIALRRAELDAALLALAPNRAIRVIRAGLADGRTRDRDAAETIDTLLQHRSIAGARTIWSTWARDPHCDHRTAGIIALMLAERIDASLWSFAVWGRFGERPVPADLRRFHDNTHAAAKRAAIAAHASQTTAMIDDDPAGFVMPPALVEHFATHPEIFVRER